MASSAAQRFAEGGPRVIVAGATGFTGALAAHLLWRHPDFELTAVTGRSELGRPLQEVYPRYRVPLAIEPLDVERLEGIDAAVVAYPHAAAAPTVGALRERGIRVVDLSADFRLGSLAAYERWYGEHPRPDLLDEAVYGLTELHRERIAAAAIVANPGCYPTASLLALAPLARAGLIADVVIDAKQGISGAGRVFDETTHLSIAGENIVPYKVAAHRHTPEIEEQLDAAGSRPPRRAEGPVPGAPRAARPGRDGQLLRHHHAARHRRGAAATCTRPPTPRSPSWSSSTLPPGVLEVRETNYCRVFAAADRAHRQGDRVRRDRQPLEGDLLAGRAEPQPDVRPARDEGVAVSAHGCAGSASSVARVPSTPRSLRPCPACPAGACLRHGEVGP